MLHGRVRSQEYDAVHERCIVFVDRRYWIVCDWLHADSEHDYTLNFQLGAQAQGHSELQSRNGMRLRSPGLLIAQPECVGMRHELKPGWVSQRYGEKQPAPTVQSTIRARNAGFDSVLLPWRDQEPMVDLRKYTFNTDTYENIVQVVCVRLDIDGEPVTDHWLYTRGGGVYRGAIGRASFMGRWLYWREAADGRVLRAAAHAGATLHDAGVALIETECV